MFHKFKLSFNAKDKKNGGKITKVIYPAIKTAIYCLPVLFCGIEVMAAGFNLDAGIKAATDPAKKMINDYYPVAIFITGAMGAIMQQQGDLRDRMLGFGKGSLIGGLVILAVKAGLGV